MYSLKTKENMAMPSTIQQLQQEEVNKNQVKMAKLNLIDGRALNLPSPDRDPYFEDNDHSSDYGNRDEKDLFKTASYKKELPRNAIRTKLKKSPHKSTVDSSQPPPKETLDFLDSNLNSSDTEDDFLNLKRPSNFDPKKGFKSKTTTSKNVIDSPTSKTTITTVTTKTLIKVNDANRSKHLCKSGFCFIKDMGYYSPSLKDKLVLEITLELFF
jgi:hypothetical protein